MNKSITTELLDNIAQFNLNSEPNIDQGERALSVVAGTFLLFKGLGSLVKHPILGLASTAAAGLLLYRGATGNCPVYKKLGVDTADPQAINITESITVNASKETVYKFWRDLSNLPKFMEHLKTVEETSDKSSHWVANTPGNIIGLSWNAEITREEEGQYIGWQSVEGSMIDNAGKVEFKDALNGVDTEIFVEISYFPPVGSIGRGFTSLFNGVFEKMIREDIISFKKYAEQADFKNYAGIASIG